LSEFEARNGAALVELIEKHNVQLKRFPADVLAQLRTLAEETVEEEANKNKLARKTADSFNKFKKQWGAWADTADRSYFDIIAKRYVEL
jgi:TRAP-type mannitol/chloroaromatic compound transport system substrate-binding protein